MSEIKLTLNPTAAPAAPAVSPEEAISAAEAAVKEAEAAAEAAKKQEPPKPQFTPEEQQTIDEFSKQIDVTDPKDVDRVVSEIVKDFGRLDISIHVAGGSARIAGAGTKYVDLWEQDPYVIDRVLQVNLYGAIWVSRAAARVMVSQGEGGRIVCFSSIIAQNGLAHCADYAAAKGGVISLV